MNQVALLVVLPEDGAITPGAGALVAASGHLAARYAGRRGVTYLIRPDSHVAARFHAFDPAALSEALARATGLRAEDLAA